MLISTKDDGNKHFAATFLSHRIRPSPTILKGRTAMFKQILVPLDGSTRAEQALPVAARLARASHSSIILMRVANFPMDYGGGYTQAPLLTEQVIETELDNLDDYLRKVAISETLAGISIKTEAMFGQPLQDILSVSRVETSRHYCHLQPWQNRFAALGTRKCSASTSASKPSSFTGTTRGWSSISHFQWRDNASHLWTSGFRRITFR